MLFLPSNQFPVEGDGILQAALACDDVMVGKVFVEFFYECFSYACYIFIQRISHRIDDFGDGEVDPASSVLGRSCR